MDTKQDVLHVLRCVAEGCKTPEEALLELKMAPYEDVGCAKIDHHRSVRQGAAEVIYGAGKNPNQISQIVGAMGRKGGRNILITRLSPEKAAAIDPAIPLEYREIPQLAIAFPCERPLRGKVVVATAGTSDASVAEEAACTAEVLGSRVVRMFDVGVAGLHRLLSNLDAFMAARCVVAVAGMEGALASVVGGLVDCPVIAVPTSVGYGANFGGLSALLSMLNSCASGSSVVNIDNGFGAGYLASMINQMEGIDE